jgi:hypothetical protein
MSITTNSTDLNRRGGRSVSSRSNCWIMQQDDPKSNIYTWLVGVLDFPLYLCEVRHVSSMQFTPNLSFVDFFTSFMFRAERAFLFLPLSVHWFFFSCQDRLVTFSWHEVKHSPYCGYCTYLQIPKERNPITSRRSLYTYPVTQYRRNISLSINVQEKKCDNVTQYLCNISLSTNTCIISRQMCNLH